jgi:hypothetical protein
MKLSNLKQAARIRGASIGSDKLILYPHIVGLLCIIIGVIIIPLTQKLLPDMVPLFYSLPRAEERLAHKSLLYVLPLSSFIILLINIAVVFFFTWSDKVISRILAFSSLLVAILSVYTLVRILLLIA